MAILGYNTKGIQAIGMTAVKYSQKHTLAAPATLTELHGWFNGAGATNLVILFIYSDVGGAPTTRLAYTSPISVTGSTDTDYSQAGFSVALAAGDYWIGFQANTTNGNFFRESAGGTSAQSSYSVFNPPDTPYGSFTATARKHSVWAVVGASSTTYNGSATVSLTDTVTTAGTVRTAPVAAFSGTPLSGAAPLSVVFTDLSTP